MFCRKCGRNLGAGDKFCSGCGTVVETEMCPACGAELENGAAFCSKCGAVVGGVNGGNVNIPQPITLGNGSVKKSNKTPLSGAVVRLFGVVVIVMSILAFFVPLARINVGQDRGITRYFPMVFYNHSTPGLKLQYSPVWIISHPYWSQLLSPVNWFGVVYLVLSILSVIGIVICLRNYIAAVASKNKETINSRVLKASLACSIVMILFFVIQAIVLAVVTSKSYTMQMFSATFGVAALWVVFLLLYIAFAFLSVVMLRKEKDNAAA